MENVSVIVVSHNNKEILPKCLDSIKNQSYKQFKIYLLDNDSTDNTREFVQKNYPYINFIDVPKEGPSKKRNIGIEKSDSKYILTLDSDVILTKNWMKNAVNYMDTHKDVGICGGKLLNKEGLIDFAGGVISKIISSGDIGHNEKDEPKYNTFKRVSYITTAASMIRREMIQEIGVFDETYFYGYEDADLGLRANLAKWKVVYNPNLIAEHLYHFTVSQKSQTFIKSLLIRNRIATLLKDFELKTILIYSPLIFASLIYGLREGIHANLLAYLEVIKNMPLILKKRRENFRKRKITDKQLFDDIYFPLRINGKNNEIFDYFRKVRNESMRNLFFFVTTHCNSKCKHCFYWKSLNQKKDLTLKEIEKIFSKFYNIHSIVLSGGEPFMRKDLDKVVDILVKYTDTKYIFIPTNCIMDITDRFENILKRNPQVSFIICASLDGFEEDHDFIRGIKGSFNNTINLIKKLSELKKRYPNFKQIVVNTVLMNRNYNNLVKFIDFVKTLPVDQHAFDIIRGEYQKEEIGSLSSEQIKKISQLRYETAKFYDKKSSFIRKIHGDMAVKEFIRTQIRIANGKNWNFKCRAGRSDFVIESDGSARICELQPKIGDLLKNSPEELLNTENAKEIFRKIDNHKCDCTHTCIIASSMERSIKNVFWTRIWGWVWPLPKK
ncbi:MAG: glycosyltransferase [Nanoarchaeota archaeon]|nr:glycosyltransferase [Nanoarchaeota archaeon]